MTGIVYRYVLQAPGDENGWSYIGETMNPEQRRRNWLMTHASYFGKIGDARTRYGISDDVWKYEVLETITTNDKDSLKQILEQREAFYIAKYNSVAQGFNTSAGGLGNKGVNFSPEWRAKIGAANKGRTRDEDTRKRISQKLMGHTVSQEVRDKISAGNKGKKRTEAQRQAQSLRMKGKVMSDVARAKSSATKKGKPHPISPEGMANINANRYRIGIIAINHEGEQIEYNSLSEAAIQLNQSVAAISHLLKTGSYGKHGYRFIKK